MIENYVRAGYPAIFCVTSEEVRLQKELVELCNNINRQLYVWSITEGLVHVSIEEVKSFPDTENPESL